MASTITLQVVDPTPAAPALLDAARQVFARVEVACTRFDPTSSLMQANAGGDEWCAVSPECYDALVEAARAHVDTDGLFDPRVLESLRALGYDRTLPFASGEMSLKAAADLPRPRSARDVGSWSPGFDPSGRVRIGPRPVDLGGIGKGLAVRWASDALAQAGRAHLIEAGGDCYLAGDGPDGTGWRVAVEDPHGGPGPVAVLRLQDAGCATSSLRLRSWRVDGRRVHHLIDPRTGASAAGGLSAVTVVAADTAWAEVWSKALLIEGRDGIAALGEERGLAALWVDEEGRLGWTAAMNSFLMWVGPDA
jgi:thiamine biosynthesis lipoprotein